MLAYPLNYLESSYMRITYVQSARSCATFYTASSSHHTISHVLQCSMLGLYGDATFRNVFGGAYGAR